MSFNNDPNQTPEWALAIQQNRLQDAEAQLTQSAANRVYISGELEKIQSHPYAKYTHMQALQKVDAQVRSGQLQNERQALEAYRTAMREEISTFEKEIRPGYARDAYNPSTPADAEVRDYIAERRAQQAAMKEEGRRITAPPSPLTGRR